jgi:hypothetical protein
VTSKGNLWRKYVYEAIVIVLSILLAFTIDAWWDNKGNETQKEALLLVLKEDFIAAKTQLVEQKETHLRIERNLENLLKWSDSTYLSEELKIQFDTLLGVLFWREIYDPPLGTLESIISSSRFDMIENDSLTAKLTKWPSMVSHLNEREIEKIEHFYDAYYPYIRKHISLKDFDNGVPRSVSWEHNSTKAYTLLSHLEFQNILYWHWVLQWNINFNIPEMEQAIDDILELTQTELDN